METRKLGHTDLHVSRICFGTMTFGSQMDEATAHRTLDYCVGHDINFIDTANVYNKGESEKITGKWLKGNRGKVVLATKVRGKMGEAPDQQGLSKAAILKAIDESLSRLQTDHVDLYYLHQPDYAVPIDESLEAMESLVKAGKVRYPASSNYSGWQVAEMLALADKNHWTPATVTQPMYNLLARGIEQDYLPMVKHFGLATCVYNPIAGGMLTGKQKRDQPQAGTRFDNNQMYLDRYWHPAYFDAVDRLGQIAAAAQRSLISLSLNWILHHTAADCVILGASKLEQLEQNLATLADGPVEPTTVEACDQVWRDLRGITPKYNR
ncbi:MAG TPA: aldo/keto reductase [Bryobacteraceae bacterium]|jgi:aryl-alcohol dehydrogenase-like predicted oxidoreductase